MALPTTDQTLDAARMALVISFLRDPAGGLAAARGPLCSTPGAQIPRVPNGYVSVQPGEARGSEVSLRSVLQDQLFKRQVGQRLLQPGVLTPRSFSRLA